MWETVPRLEDEETETESEGESGDEEEDTDGEEQEIEEGNERGNRGKKEDDNDNDNDSEILSDSVSESDDYTTGQSDDVDDSQGGYAYGSFMIEPRVSDSDQLEFESFDEDTQFGWGLTTDGTSLEFGNGDCGGSLRKRHIISVIKWFNQRGYSLHGVAPFRLPPHDAIVAIRQENARQKLLYLPIDDIPTEKTIPTLQMGLTLGCDMFEYISILLSELPELVPPGKVGWFLNTCGWAEEENTPFFTMMKIYPGVIRLMERRTLFAPESTATWIMDTIVPDLEREKLKVS